MIGPVTHHLGIDTTATAGSNFVRRLRALKSTVRLQDWGIYDLFSDWRMLYVETTMTEKELDNWCWRFHDKSCPLIETSVFEWGGEIPE